MAEKQSSCTIEVLCTDNGGKFAAMTFKAFWWQEGILRQSINSYTPKQNGVVVPWL